MERASELINVCDLCVQVENGRCVSAFGDTVTGVWVGTMEFARKNGREVPSFSRHETEEWEGVFIDIEPEMVCSQPICISFTGTGRCGIAVRIGKGASAELIFLFSDSVSCERIVEVGGDAALGIKEVLLGAEGNSLTVSGRVNIAQGACVNTVSVELGRGVTETKYVVSLRGALSQSVHAGLFLAGNGERKATDVRVEHLAADCHSDVMVKGVAFATGYGSFTGMVYVAQDAQRTQAYQQSRNLLMSPEARIVTSPQLEIYADDVKCSHGATVGQMNDEAVYYMRQRGLSEVEARGLQLTGFVNDVISRLGEGELAARVLAAAQQRIRMLQSKI